MRFDFLLIHQLQILCVCDGLKLNYGKLLHLEAIKHLYQVLEIFLLLKRMVLFWKKQTQNGDILKSSIITLSGININQNRTHFFVVAKFNEQRRISKINHSIKCPCQWMKTDFDLWHRKSMFKYFSAQRIVFLMTINNVCYTWNHSQLAQNYVQFHFFRFHGIVHRAVQMI